MGTAPLDRDTQIELMKTARERHEALVQRWKENETIRKVLRKPAKEQTSGYQMSTTDMKISRCG